MKKCLSRRRRLSYGPGWFTDQTGPACMTIGEGTIVRTTLPLQEIKRIPKLSAATAARRLMRLGRAGI